MMAALEAAYKGTMMQGKFPGAVLMLEMTCPTSWTSMFTRPRRRFVLPKRGDVS